VKRFVALGVVLTAMLAFGAASASAAVTTTYTFAGQGSPDSGTCGNDWANDTYTRAFKVVTLQNTDGSWRVTENFKKGKFTTVQGASPESCQAGNTSQVSSGLKGTFTGSEVIKVSGGSYDAVGAGNCSAAANPPACTTAEFIDSAFPGNSGYAVSDFYFQYHTANLLACANTWINAATGNAGDIATICN
jgi:hypothetical protein